MSRKLLSLLLVLSLVASVFTVIPAALADDNDLSSDVTMETTENDLATDTLNEGTPDADLSPNTNVNSENPSDEKAVTDDFQDGDLTLDSDVDSEENDTTLSNNKALENELSSDYISERTVETIVTNFITRRNNVGGLPNTFPSDFSLEKDLTMYDYNDVPSAYKFNVLDEEGNYSGYIIAGAQESYPAIIEFSCSTNKSRMDTKRKVIQNEYNSTKVYYTGEFDYVIAAEDNSGSEELFSMKSGKAIDSTKNSLVQNAASVLVRKTNDTYTKSREALLQSNNFTVNHYSVGGEDLSYVTMDDFVKENNCAQIAATNLMIWCFYEKNLRKLKYPNKYTSSWESTYKKLYHSTEGSIYGTNCVDLRDGITSYAKNYGKYTEWTMGLGRRSTGGYPPRDSPTFVDVMKKAFINYSNPLIIEFLSREEYYGSHYVFALGFDEYLNEDNTSDNYFTLVDGWGYELVSHFIPDVWEPSKENVVNCFMYPMAY